MEQVWLSATGGHGTVMEVVLLARESKWTRSIRSDIEVADVNLLRNWGGSVGSKMVAMFCAYISSGVNSRAKQRSERLSYVQTVRMDAQLCSQAKPSLFPAECAFYARHDRVGELYFYLNAWTSILKTTLVSWQVEFRIFVELVLSAVIDNFIAWTYHLRP